MTTIEEERVERRFNYLRSFMQSASAAELAELEALAERIRVELMIGGVDPAAKPLYRAAAHYLEDAAERRHEKEGTDRLGARRAVADYLKLLIEGIRT
jgi:hypothetical protein